MKTQSTLRAILFAGVLGIIFGIAVPTAYAEGRGDGARIEWITQRQSSRLEAARQAKVDAAESEQRRIEQQKNEREDSTQENQCLNC